MNDNTAQMSTKLHAVCGHIGFIARYDPGGAVLDHLEQLPVRMVP